MANIEAFRFRKAISSSINQNLIFLSGKCQCNGTGTKAGIIWNVKVIIGLHFREMSKKAYIHITTYMIDTVQSHPKVFRMMASKNEQKIKMLSKKGQEIQKSS